MEKGTALPKNIRQIGEIQGKEKVCIEDYVMTYIHKKEPQEEKGYLGVFLGERKETEEGTYVFIRGILEMSFADDQMKAAQRVREEKRKEEMHTEAQDGKDGELRAQNDQEEKIQVRDEHGKERETMDGNAVKAAQENKEEKKGKLEKAEIEGKTLQEEGTPKETEEVPLNSREWFEKQKEEYFPGWEIQGCCVIGMYQPKQLEQLAEIAPEAGQLIYHLQEQEETLYWRDAEEYRRLRGYLVFYEQNRKMQEYMTEEFKDKSVEKESLPDQAIRSFREKIREKGEKRTGSMLRLASSFFVVTVLIVGAIAVNRIDDIRAGRNALKNGQEALSGQVQQEGERLPASDPGADGGSTATSGNVLGQPGAGTDTAGDLLSVADTIQNTAEGLQGTAGNMQNAAEGMQGTAGNMQSAAAGMQNTAEGVQGAAGNIQNTAAGMQGNTGNVQNTAEGVQGTAGNMQNSAEGMQDATGNLTNQADSMQGGADVLQNTDTAQSGGQNLSGDGNIQSSGGTGSIQGTGNLTGAAGGQDVSGTQSSESARDTSIDSTSGMNSSPVEGSAADTAGTQSSTTDGTSAPPAASETSSRAIHSSYVIRQGDTLADICSRYYGSLDRVEEICSVNHIADANMIMPGQKIVLP